MPEPPFVKALKLVSKVGAEKDALHADLKAVAMALEISVICIETARRAIAESSGPLIPGGPIVEHLIYARKALARPGVQEILKSG